MRDFFLDIDHGLGALQVRGQSLDLQSQLGHFARQGVGLAPAAAPVTFEVAFLLGLFPALELIAGHAILA